MGLADFKALIESSQRIAIFSHTMPDADAIFSSLALKFVIEKNIIDKKVDVFVDMGESPSPLYEPFLNNIKIAEQNYPEYDLTISLDCPQTNRFSKYENLFLTAKHTVNIDHHETNTNFAELNFVAPNISSSGELLFHMIKKMEYSIPVEAAKFIFTCIITDTVCLTQNNVSKATYKALAELSSMPFDQEAIKTHFFKTNTKAKTFLLEKALSSIRFYEDDKIAIMKIQKKDIDKLEATQEDTLGIVEHANNIDGVMIAAIIIENEPNKFYVSLRGKGEIKVSEIATEFGGGGHANMAAFQHEGDLKELNANLVRTCINAIHEKEQVQNLEEKTL